jgi:hypothetical protein
MGGAGQLSGGPLVVAAHIQDDGLAGAVAVGGLSGGDQVGEGRSRVGAEVVVGGQLVRGTDGGSGELVDPDPGQLPLRVGDLFRGLADQG